VLAALGDADIPVVVGGIIPEADIADLEAAGVAAVYTPKDFEITRILRAVVGIVADRAQSRPPRAAA
jgi:(2R)-ethylmalonyl-CoA mutase